MNCRRLYPPSRLQGAWWFTIQEGWHYSYRASNDLACNTAANLATKASKQMVKEGWKEIPQEQVEDVILTTKLRPKWRIAVGTWCWTLRCVRTAMARNGRTVNIINSKLLVQHRDVFWAPCNLSVTSFDSPNRAGKEPMSLTLKPNQGHSWSEKGWKSHVSARRK